MLSEDLRAGAKILNGDYHLALNNKCGKTVNKSHRKAAAAVRLTTANLLRLLSAAPRSSVEKSENERHIGGVISFKLHI